jgi:hypothetical protein
MNLTQSWSAWRRKHKLFFIDLSVMRLRSCLISAGRNLRYPFLSYANKSTNKFGRIFIPFCTQVQVYVSILVPDAWLILQDTHSTGRQIKFVVMRLVRGWTVDMYVARRLQRSSIRCGEDTATSPAISTAMSSRSASSVRRGAMFLVTNFGPYRRKKCVGKNDRFNARA